MSAMAKLRLSPQQMRHIILSTANGIVEGLAGTLESIRVGATVASDVAVVFLPDN
jgi:predicted aspartyl protease